MVLSSLLSLVLLASAGRAKQTTTPGFPSAKQQCPYRPAARLETTALLPTCPLPGYIGILPDESANAIVWDYPPKCISPPAKDNTTVSRIDCLFTSTTFRNGHGISLISSTLTTSHIIAVGSFDDEAPPLGVQRRESLGPAYEIVPVEGKGLGVVAKRKIKRGEIVMSDYPVLLIGTGFLGSAQPHHRRRMLKQAINQLPEKLRSKVKGLSRGAEKYEVDAILGPNANTVMIGEQDNEQMHVGLFAEAARINHGCRPNVHSRFSERRLTMEIMAHVAIEPGEEILMSYVPLTTVRDERRKYLKDHWGFDCKCQLCTGTKNEIEESEFYRRRQKSLKETIESARAEGFFKDAIVMSGEWHEFSEWDMVPPLAPEYHDSLADLHYSNGDLFNATRYARMAYDGWVRFGSVDDEKLEHSKSVLAQVEKEFEKSLKFEKN
ncbi:hypothetical protein QBC40DRAFT_320583 [Triangularia verruculosa]|uniref:SET domain-containing protein n=1 Tax=Triangularia verruculosa TaxID=2587418 RepID=A0AAN7AXP0_9PEZI|nr:hypothetical protein QBC40DRAFT_320583 [Triangularia verruculosa]